MITSGRQSTAGGQRRLSTRRHVSGCQMWRSDLCGTHGTPPLCSVCDDIGPLKRFPGFAPSFCLSTTPVLRKWSVPSGSGRDCPFRRGRHGFAFGGEGGERGCLSRRNRRLGIGTPGSVRLTPEDENPDPRTHWIPRSRAPWEKQAEIVDLKQRLERLEGRHAVGRETLRGAARQRYQCVRDRGCKKTDPRNVQDWRAGA